MSNLEESGVCYYDVKTRIYQISKSFSQECDVYYYYYVLSSPPVMFKSNTTEAVKAYTENIHFNNTVLTYAE